MKPDMLLDAIIGFLVFLVQDSYAGFCSYRYSVGLSYATSYMYCYDDCCGSYYNRYCCYITPTGTIAGAVVGALVVGAVVVGIVIFICIKNKRAVRGRIIAPQPAAGGVAVIHTTHSHQPVQQVNYGYAPPPPPMTGYNQQPMTYPPPPPQYPGPPPAAGTNPAYPPPPMPSYAAGPSAPMGFSSQPPPGVPHKM